MVVVLRWGIRVLVYRRIAQRLAEFMSHAREREGPAQPVLIQGVLKQSVKAA